MDMTVESLARAIDHTLLKPEATANQIDTLCDQAVAFGFGGVCVNPIFVRRVHERLQGSRASSGNKQLPKVVSVVGFPLGASRLAIKEAEAQRALDDGAAELDIVIHVGALIEGDARAVRREIEAIARITHQAQPAGLLKVILETGVLTPEQIVLGCRCCAEGEADYVKTSTGLHPGGGATLEDVRLLHKHASPIKVKAAGGIRSAETALAMLKAGASRLGTSAGAQIVEEARSILG